MRRVVAMLALVAALVTGVRTSDAAEKVDILVVSGDLQDIKVCVGEFTVTTYCACRACNGKWTGMPTASGAPLEVGTTIAVDPDVIPLGTEVVLELEDGRKLYREAQDTGNKIKGEIIDLLIDDCGGRVTYYNVKVWVPEETEDAEE